MYKNSKNRTNILKIVIALLICSILAFIVFIGLTLAGGFPEKTNKISHYGEFDSFRGYSGLLIFPNSIPEYDNKVKYYHYCRDTIFDPTCQVYLKCTYTDEDYINEKERLSQIEVTNEKKQVNKILYDEKSFILPAYVASAGWNSCYEYALIDDKTFTITYVFLQNINSKYAKCGMKQLPNYYGKLNNYGNDEYNIYIFKDSAVGGYEMVY